jgi:ribose transport system permease protein
MLTTAGAVGAINGIVYVFGRLPHPFIITLATLSICRGLALELAIGHTTMRGMPEAIITVGGSSTFAVPNSFFVVVAVATCALIMAKFMVWGRWIYAVGGEPEALYGNLLELDTIAAVIIGGASFLGGRGHVGHALVGAVMIGVIRNALNLLNVDVFFQMIAIGLIIVVAVEADVLRNHLEARTRALQAARTQ